MTAAMNAESAAKKKQDKKSSLAAAAAVHSKADTNSDPSCDTALLLPASDKTGGSTAPPSKSKHKEGSSRGGKGDKDAQEEWVQCDACARWRTLPPPGDALYPLLLPEQWTCAMNTWHPDMKDLS